MKQSQSYRIKHQKMLYTGDTHFIYFLSPKACVLVLGPVSVVQVMAGIICLIAIILTPTAVNHYS